MVMPCSRSAFRPSVSRARSISPAPVVPTLLAVAFHGGELVLVDHLGVVQQPADERALAVVDAAAGEEAQQLLLLVAGEVGVDVFLTQVNGLHFGEGMHLEVPLALLLLHRPRLVVVDHPALPLGVPSPAASPR